MPTYTFTPDQSARLLAWATDLETTTAQQARAVLHDPGSGTYCCLGRLLDALYVQEGLGVWVDGAYQDNVPEIGSARIQEIASTELPYTVSLEMGLYQGTGQRYLEGNFMIANDDAQYSFPQIAAIIRRLVATGEWIEEKDLP